MSDRPLIGVTTSERSGWRIFPLVAFNIWLAGGRAVRFGTNFDNNINDMDGLIVGGGDDISPDLYKGELIASARVDPARDALEKDLISRALDRNMPLLGICRGSQMLNVVLGGDLHQDAYGVYTASEQVWTILPKKRVSPLHGTRLSDILGAEPMSVNALHSQAVDRLGDGLRVAARDPGGMIQAVERLSDPFAIGVQWHPEHLFYAKRQRALFKSLVIASEARTRLDPQLETLDAHPLTD